MIDNTVSKLLIYFGFAPQRNGFKYIQIAASMFAADPSMTLKKVYETIATSYQCNAISVDSSIRNSIRAAYDSGKLARINSNLDFEIIDMSNCPTNKQFIYSLNCFLSFNNIEIPHSK